jgi:hypothetical protein
MPNYTTKPNLSSYLPQDPFEVGAQYGKAIGNVAGGLHSIAGDVKREGLPFGMMEGTKAKSSSLIAEYGDPQSDIFKGLVGSQRTNKLVSLLQPLDPAMASRYETRAGEERNRDYGMTSETTEDDGNLEAEIAKTEKAIEAIKVQLDGPNVAPMASASTAQKKDLGSLTTAQGEQTADYTGRRSPVGINPMSNYLPMDNDYKGGH